MTYPSGPGQAGPRKHATPGEHAPAGTGLFRWCAVVLLAHIPETSIALALVAVIAGVTMPLFERLGFGSFVSLLYGVGCGVVVVGALMVRARIADARYERGWRRQSERRGDTSDGQSG